MKSLHRLFYKLAIILLFVNCSKQADIPVGTNENAEEVIAPNPIVDNGGNGGLPSFPPSLPPPFAPTFDAANIHGSPSSFPFPGGVPFFPRPKLDEDEKNPVNGWINARTDSLSTFAADVDTGSYTLARATINNEEKPDPKDIRVEEFINYFPYDYDAPQEGEVFKVNMDLGPSPFNQDNKLLRVGILGKTLDSQEQKSANLVFLVDVSGSMSGPARLELAQRSMEVLVNTLKETDRIAIVTYASDTKVVLPSTFVKERGKILDAIYGLNAEGSTAMGDGITLAYKEAVNGMQGENVNSRVIILSDGDANVGLTSHEEILDTIKEEVKKGIFLTTMGFGLGNYRDEMMEQLANSGNGNYYYVDSFSEAKRVFHAEATGVLEVIAKDLKIQVQFDPEKVSEYRLIGYENRDINDEDFRNDEIDAGELGAGHRVTALYELKLKENADLNECATVRLRFKDPKNADQIRETEEKFTAENVFDSFATSPKDFKLALVVALFAEILRESSYAANITLQDVQNELISFMEANNSIEQELLELMQKVQ